MYYINFQLYKSQIIQTWNLYQGPSRVGVPHLKHKDSFLGHPNSPFFFIKPMTYLMFPFFFLYQMKLICSKFYIGIESIYCFTSIRIVKFIECEPCAINGLKFLEILLFGNFIHHNLEHLVLVTLEHFIYIRS